MKKKDLIPELQALFCSRASLLEAKDKLNRHKDLDCQIRLRFANGHDMPLKISRTGIETIIDDHLAEVETSIQKKLDAVVNPNRSLGFSVLARCL